MEMPLTGINRRQFLSSTAAMAAAPAWVAAAAAPAGQVSGQPASLVEVMSGLAPQGLTLKPGPGFAMERNGEMLAWELDSLKNRPPISGSFATAPRRDSRLPDSLRLDRTFRAGEFRVKLTNTSDRRSMPLTRLFSLPAPGS